MLITIGVAASLAIAAPASKCDISMENWCIAQLPSSVTMKETSGHREWTISLNEDVSSSIIRIVEDKFCDGSLDHRRVQVSDKEFKLLSASDCGLHIHVLSKEENISSKTLIERSIFLRKDDRWLPVPRITPF